MPTVDSPPQDANTQQISSCVDDIKTVLGQYAARIALIDRSNFHRLRDSLEAVRAKLETLVNQCVGYTDLRFNAVNGFMRNSDADPLEWDWYATPAVEIVLANRKRIPENRWPEIALLVVMLPETNAIALILYDANRNARELSDRLAENRQHVALWLADKVETENSHWQTDALSRAQFDPRLVHSIEQAFISSVLSLDKLTDTALKSEFDAILPAWTAYETLPINERLNTILPRTPQSDVRNPDKNHIESRLPMRSRAPSATCAASNTILYGPPGTGKTYCTARRALEICQPDVNWSTHSYAEVMHEYRHMQALGRIELVTFHQSFGYEEFVEGIRPVLDDVDDEASTDSGEQVRYRCEHGVFKKIALLAASQGLELSQDDQDFETRWEALHNKILAHEDFRTKSKTGQPYIMRAIEGPNKKRLFVQNIDGSSAGKPYILGDSAARRWWQNRDKLGQEFERIGNSEVKGISPGDFTPNWMIYRELWLLTPEELTAVNETVKVETLDKDARIEFARKYLNDGMNSRFTQFNDAENYVLIIDEINRGNISKILGELITLLEPTKRLTAEQELIVTLPYSKERFALPPNLHILGTMNTADRSIALMDIALRRRFAFEPMMPDVNVIKECLTEKLQDSDGALTPAQEQHIKLVCTIFTTINKRIKYLKDIDHQIGHSYFLNATTMQELRATFLRNVIPLLQEYFYQSWPRICRVLGSPIENSRSTSANFIIESKEQSAADLFNDDFDDDEGTFEYRLADKFIDPKTTDEELRKYFIAILQRSDAEKFRILELP